jgi:hypothetical protein
MPIHEACRMIYVSMLTRACIDPFYGTLKLIWFIQYDQPNESSLLVLLHNIREYTNEVVRSNMF